MQIRSQVMRGMILGAGLALLAPLALAVWGNSRPDPVVLEGKIKANLRQLGGWEVTYLGSAVREYYSLSLKHEGLFYSVYFDPQMAGKTFQVTVSTREPGGGPSAGSEDGHGEVRFDGPDVKSVERVTYVDKPSFHTQRTPIIGPERQRLVSAAHELYFVIYQAVHAK